jgi:hypothetical protein
MARKRNIGVFPPFPQICIAFQGIKRAVLGSILLKRQNVDVREVIERQ